MVEGNWFTFRIGSGFAGLVSIWIGERYAIHMLCRWDSGWGLGEFWHIGESGKKYGQFQIGPLIGFVWPRFKEAERASQ